MKSSPAKLIVSIGASAIIGLFLSAFFGPISETESAQIRREATTFMFSPAGYRELGLSALVRDARPGDTLPSLVGREEVSNARLIVDSVRKLDHAELPSWVARTLEGDVCFLATPSQDLDMIGTVCTDEQRFKEQGLGIQLISPGGAAEFYLLPDSIAKSPEIASSLSLSLRGNVLRIDAFANRQDRRTLQTALRSVPGFVGTLLAPAEVEQ